MIRPEEVQLSSLVLILPGIHRVIVVDENGKFRGLISQFDMLALLEPCLSVGHELASKVGLLY